MEKKKKIVYDFCLLKIKPTSSNIFVTLTDLKGNVILKSTAGIIKFTGKKKNTAYVAENVIKNLVLSIKKNNLQINLLIIQFFGFLKNYAFRKSMAMLHNLEIKVLIGYINTIKYAHNGVKLKKTKRL